MRRCLLLTLVVLMGTSCGGASDGAVEVGTYAIAEAELLAGVAASAAGESNTVDASFGDRSDLLTALDVAHRTRTVGMWIWAFMRRIAGTNRCNWIRLCRSIKMDSPSNPR